MMPSARDETGGVPAHGSALTTCVVFKPAAQTLLAVVVASFLAGTNAHGQALGPRDQGRFPPTDTSRVAVGAAAPDFTLESLSGPAVTLSAFRGRQRVILVFYRGHW